LLGDFGPGFGFLAFQIPAYGLAVWSEGVFGPDDGGGFGFFLIEFDFVDSGVEAVVVGAQGVEDCPDHFVAFVVVQGFVGLDVGGDKDGDDDVAVFFARRFAHDSPDGLHYVHGGIAGGEEENGVERGNVYPFAEAAHVGEDATFAVCAVCFEPAQEIIPFGGGHSTVYVAGDDRDGLGAFVLGQGGDVGIGGAVVDGGDAFGDGDALAEGHGAAHGSGVGGLDCAVVADDPLGEGVDAADELGGVVGVDFVVLVGDHVLDGGGNVAVAQGEDHDFVVGEQVALDCFPEADAVDFCAVELLVIHGAEDGFGFGGFALAVVAVEAFGCLDVGVVVDFGEGGFVFVFGGGEFDAGGAMGFVADDKVEGAESAATGEEPFLGLGDDINGLVGGEDDGQPCGGVGAAFQFQELVVDGGDVGWGGQGQVYDAGEIGVFVSGLTLGDFGIGADADGVDGVGGVGAPFPQGLAQKGDGRDKKEDEAGAVGFVFGNAQGCEGFAGSAGHDEFAPVGCTVVGVGLFQGGALVFKESFAGCTGCFAVDACFQLLPVYGGFCEVVEAEDADGRVLVFDCFSGVGAPMVGGGDPEATGKAGGLQVFVAEGAAGGGKERIDGRFVDDGAFLVALALDSPVVAVYGEGNEIDAGVPTSQVVAAREFIPEPDLLEEAGVGGCGFEVGLHEALEAVAFVTFGEGDGPVFGKEVVEAHGLLSACGRCKKSAASPGLGRMRLMLQRQNCAKICLSTL